MAFLSDYELLQLLEKDYSYIDNGLLYGKAGLALYYANLSNHDETYEKIYKRLINDVLSSVKMNSSLGFTDGLTGICLAIDYILHFYKKGNADYILGDVIPEIYKSFDLNKSWGQYSNQIPEGLFFFVMHLKYGAKNIFMKKILLNKVISLLEYVYSHELYVYNEEPMPGQIFINDYFFFVSISSMYSQGFYQERITHICNEVILRLFQRTPVLQFNRFVRLYCVNMILSSVHHLIPLWSEYSSFLSRLLIENLQTKELQNGQLCLNDGICGILYLLKNTSLIASQYDFIHYSEDLVRFIDNTPVCDDCRKFSNIPQHYFGINGIWGMKYIIKKYHI